MKLTVGNRRFLTVWICINAFALFVNIAQLEGRIDKGHNAYQIADEKENDQRKGYYAEFSYTNDIICIFMDKNTKLQTDGITFYPFTSKFIKINYGYRNKYDHTHSYSFYESGFLGIFNGYDYLEFIVYTVLGFSIVYIPKLWKDNR
jgi:hypothetical protein